MLKVWLLVAAVFIILLVMRVLGKQSGKRGVEDEGDRPVVPEVMVPCAVCGLHVPRGEARIEDRSFYCCEEHMHLGSGRRDP